MIRAIPLEPGSAHLAFRVELSGVSVRIRLDWLTRFGYYTTRIDGPDGLLVAGAGLHPDMNLLVDVPSIPGRLYIDGVAPTVGNLGDDARLVYET